MRTRRKLVLTTAAAALLLGALAPAAQAGRDKQTPVPTGIGWEWTGGVPVVGVSADGPKKSNSYAIDGATGGFVYYRGYWDVPVTSYAAGFSYLASSVLGGGSPRISVMMADGSVAYLDPTRCPSAATGAWITTSFFRVGADCTVDTTWGSFTGTDAVYDTNGVLVTPGTSAWNTAMQAAESGTVSYSFLIVDSGGPITVDRVRFGGEVLSFWSGPSQEQPRV